MDTPSLTPLNAGLRCDAPAACPSPDQVRTFLDALASAPTEAPAFALPAADQPATPETLRTTLETLAATQASFAQSVADFQEAAAPLLEDAPAASLFLPKTEVSTEPGPSSTSTRPGFISDPPRVDLASAPGSTSTRPGFISDPPQVDGASAPGYSFDRRWTIDEKAVAEGEEPGQTAANPSVAARDLPTVDCPLSTERVATRPGFVSDPPRVDGASAPGSTPTRPEFVSDSPRVEQKAAPATLSSLAEAVERFEHEQSAFAESAAQLQAAMAPILAMPLQSVEPPQATAGTEAVQATARVAEVAATPSVSPTAEAPAPTPQTMPTANLATTLRDFAATQAAFAESSQALQSAIATFLAQVPVPAPEPTPAAQSAPRAEAPAPTVSPVAPEVPGQTPPAAVPELATTLRDFAATQAAFTESVAAFQEVIRPILAQQVMPEATAMPAERAAVPSPEQPKVAQVAEVPAAKAEAPAREEWSAPGEVESAKVVFMAMEPPALQTVPVQSAPQSEAAAQTQSAETSMREALPAAVTEAVEAVARALVVEPSGTVVVRLSEQTLAGSEVRLEVRDGTLEVAFAPATGEVRELLVQQQGALTAQLVERFAGRWQVAVTIGESWRRKEEVSR